MDHLIPARKPDLVLIIKKKITCCLVHFTAPLEHSENKRKLKDRQVLGACQRTKKKLWKMWVTVIPTIFDALEKSAGDLRRLALTQTSVKNHQLMLV